MGRKVGQIIARGDRRSLIRVYLGRDHQTNKRNYHSRTIHGSMREAPKRLTRKLTERDLDRDLEGAKISLRASNVVALHSTMCNGAVHGIRNHRQRTSDHPEVDP